MSVIEAEKQKLPPDILHALEPVQLRLVTVADEEFDDLLGLFEGNSLLDGDSASAEDMPRITLFLQNIWDEAGEKSTAYEKEVRITWLHEIGHYLGWSEDELDARGLN